MVCPCEISGAARLLHLRESAGRLRGRVLKGQLEDFFCNMCIKVGARLDHCSKYSVTCVYY